MIDKEWEEIKDYIKEKKGRTRNDDRKFLNGVSLNEWKIINLKTTTEMQADYIVKLELIKTIY